MRSTLIFALVTLAGVFSAAPARAQDGSQTGRVTGSVVDATGGTIVGATVTLRIAGVERRSVTDAEGRFAFEAVTLRRGTVTVTFPNFEPVTAAVESAAPLRLVLKPDSIAEVVTVSGSDLLTPRVAAGTKTPTPLRDVPQSISVVTRELIADQRMQSIADVVRYMPGVGIAQGEGNRDTPILRGNSSTADFFVDGVRDDVQYFRDLYNVERVEAIKGPNALLFGRGGGGGVINRVSRQAQWAASRELGVQVASWNDRRLTADLGTALNRSLAARLTGVYQHADSYRSGVGLERYGVNPTVAWALGPNTSLRAGYEYFHDARTADRGIPSFAGRPVATTAATFFGNADLSPTTATVNVLSSLLEHRFRNGVVLRNRVSYGNYDKFYQNVFPGAVNETATAVSLSAYNQATLRANLFNQTDLIATARTGWVGHTLLAGVELGRQVTDNFRTTGFFTAVGANVTSVSVPLASPTTSMPVQFRQGATDADNHGIARTAGVYFQDQLTLSARWQAIIGVRFDEFNVDFRNNRTAVDFASTDGLLSPRAGLIFKPSTPVSIYGSYSLSYLPRAGEQLGSLSLTNQGLDPEEFRNYELGAKWDVRSALSVTAGAYRLDRGNVAVPDPRDPTRSMLVDAQRTKGLELAVDGSITRAWIVVGGYAYQDGRITQGISATAQVGAVLAQVPTHSFSLWNKYDLSTRWAAAIGVIRRGAIFTSTDNSVVLPAFTRVDSGVFFTVNDNLRAQLNVENLLDLQYYASAHSNTNITPGSPRAFRLAITTRF